MKNKNQESEPKISRLKKFHRSGCEEDSGENAEESRPVWIDWDHTPGHDKEE